VQLFRIVIKLGTRARIRGILINAGYPFNPCLNPEKEPKGPPPNPALLLGEGLYWHPIVT